MKIAFCSSFYCRFPLPEEESPIEHSQGVKKMYAETKTKLLPISIIAGKEFLVDIKERELRDFDNPRIAIKMHSSQGKQMIKEMQETEWNSMGICTGRNNGLEV